MIFIFDLFFLAMKLGLKAARGTECARHWPRCRRSQADQRYSAVFSDFFPMLRERGAGADQIDGYVDVAPGMTCRTAWRPRVPVRRRRVMGLVSFGMCNDAVFVRRQRQQIYMIYESIIGSVIRACQQFGSI
ncbi:MAG TPA: hypothetical protein VGN04_14510 [Herbaspirillum sp.]